MSELEILAVSKKQLRDQLKAQKWQIIKWIIILEASKSIFGFVFIHWFYSGIMQ